MAEQIKILLKKECEPEMYLVLQFLDGMTREDQKMVLGIVQGVKLARDMEKADIIPATQIV